MKNKLILCIVHRLYFNNQGKVGGIDRIIDFLQEQNDIATIEHPFEKINHASIYQTKNGERKYHLLTRAPFNWIEEFFVNMWWIMTSNKQFDFAVASDPLNMFSLSVAKKLGKIKKIQFHSTDYSNPRFTNPLLETIYQYLYTAALRAADIITVPSIRMEEQAKEKMAPSTTNKVHFLPNSPVFDAIPKYGPAKKDKNSLVILVGRWGEQIDTPLLRETLLRLKKKYPKIILHIIGNVEDIHRSILYGSDLKEHILLHGPLPYKEAMDKMAHCYIGITAYKNTLSYVHYADSLKIREYAAAGLPIVCDTIYRTAEEMNNHKAGYTYTSPEAMAEKITKLIDNPQDYKEKSKNALDWAKQLDKFTLLQKLYSTI